MKSRNLEIDVGGVLLLILALLPILEAFIRALFNTGIPGYNGYLVHVVLLIAFIGGMISAREGSHLAIQLLPETTHGPAKLVLDRFNGTLGTTITTAFFWASLSFTAVSFEPGSRIGIIPIYLFAAVMPLAFLVITFRLGKRLTWIGLLLGTIIGFSAPTMIAYFYSPVIPPWLDTLYGHWFVLLESISIPVILVLLVGAFTGVPLFIVLGGVALMLFARSGGALESVPNEGYVLLTGSTIPAIPLFTLTGFLLSESKAGTRLVHLFHALFGWMPGGLVVAAVVASAFFTTFTGASGVTILALGGLLLYILVESGRHSEDFATGILTASGTIGLLFPPSLALIIYGSVAQIAISDLFLGGIIPGILLTGSMAVVGVLVSIRNKVPTIPFNGRETFLALKEAIWEVLLPIIVIVVYFSGLATLVETAAVSVLYSLVIEALVHREIGRKELQTIARKALSIIGGVLLILALARSLSYYIIDAGVPTILRDWVEVTIHSRIVFLLLVNIVLLITGMFMDIFSAILVVAPLLIPLSSLFSINPVHLGIIFIANMGIGFITPPVGMNLFLASYRFSTPLVKIYRHVAPYFLIQLFIVLIITFWPALSTWLPGV